MEKRRLQEVSPQHCIAYGAGLEKGFNNTPLDFCCEAKNSFGTTLAKGYDQWAFDIQGPDADVVVNSRAGEEGVLECQYSVGGASALVTFLCVLCTLAHAKFTINIATSVCLHR
jgi:hypothetical protein